MKYETAFTGELAVSIEEAPSLVEVLAHLGWRHEPSKVPGKRRVLDANDRIVGDMSAYEAWCELEARGLVRGGYLVTL